MALGLLSVPLGIMPFLEPLALGAGLVLELLPVASCFGAGLALGAFFFGALAKGCARFSNLCRTSGYCARTASRHLTRAVAKLARV